MKNSRNFRYLHVKIAGGATAQCLGLMNAIYASNKLNMPFKISYYPYSTGGYWPFAIGDLLDEIEILDINKPTKGLVIKNNLEVGKIITNHPLMIKKFSYERLLSIIRKLKLESFLQFCRRELAILNSPTKLMKINRYYKSISGGFAQINEKNVTEEMHRRFIKANRKSPFIKNENQEKMIIIHYRLGDRKAAGHHHSDFNSDLIIDPRSYADVLNKLGIIRFDDIYVVSDEPYLAQKLLAEVNINTKVNSKVGDIWEDILFMSRASIFIGSNSQVSQLVNICVENNGGKSYMLNLSKKNKYSQFRNTTYLISKFIEPKNDIYSLDFKLEKNSHTAYKRDIKISDPLL